MLPATNPIRIVIADDHHLFLDGIKSLLQHYSDLEIKDQAYNGEELIEKIKKEVPDIVLTGVNMSKMNGIEATKRIKREFPSIEVIAIFQCEEDNHLLNMLKAGAKGFLLKDASGEEVVHAIRTVYKRRTYYSEEASGKIVQLMSDKSDSTKTADRSIALSDKEKLIIRMICQEYSTKQIADCLQISCRSVESTRERIMEKIGAKNMVGVALFAVQQGFYMFKSDAAS